MEQWSKLLQEDSFDYLKKLNCHDLFSITQFVPIFWRSVSTPQLGIRRETSLTDLKVRGRGLILENGAKV
ncbi:unnamed protein product [Ilex paraguariensis]|uniref:Uncharacterized protein n=1 Tax=Ilex paraguariensis TaxID=185542 RepID=A0ABC8T1X4_9AQUA